MSASIGTTRGPRRRLRKIGIAVMSVAMASTLLPGIAPGRSLTAPAEVANPANAAIPPEGLYAIVDLGGYAAFAINDYGDAVGVKADGHGFKYSGELADAPGTLTDLGPGGALAVSDPGTAFGPGHGTGPGGSALAVTPDGTTAAGTAYRSGLTAPKYGWPTGAPGIWSSAAGWRHLYDSGCRLPDLASAGAWAINSDGTLVGQAVADNDGNLTNGGTAGIAFRCFPSPTSPGTYVATNLSPPGSANAGAFAINSGGSVAGKADAGGGPIEAYVWHGGIIPESLGRSAQGHPPTAGTTSQSAAYGINDTRTVVGTYGPIATSPTLQVGSLANRAFIWTATTGMQDLTDMLPAGSPWTLTAAFDINNRGQIVGQGRINGELRAFLLTLRGDVNITADRIVVTQVIQNERNLDLLVARKTTWAILRVHSDTRDVADVTAVLRGRRDGIDLGTFRPVSPRIVVRKTPKPDITEHSLVFALPPAWTAEGNLTLEAKVNGDFRALETDYSDNEPTPATVTFRDSPLVKIVVVDPYYVGRPPPAGVNTVAYNNLRRLVGRLLPSPALDIRQEPNPIPIPEPVVFPEPDPAKWKCAGVITQLELIRSRMNLSGSTLLYGQLPLMADGTSPYVGPGGCSFVPDRVATGWTGAVADGIAAHELVHAIGRNHVPYCNAVGSDNPGYPGVATGRVYAGSLHQDAFPLPEGFDLGFNGTSFLPQSSPTELMTYCFNWWISDYTYESLYRYLPFIGIGAGDLTPPLPRHRPAVNVVGTIDLLSGATELSTIYEPLETEHRGPISGPYHIEFYDGATRLSDVRFTPIPMGPHETTGGEPPLALIDEAVVLPDGADRMAIYDDQAGREISSTPIEGAAPTVTITSPSTGGQLPASGDLTVQWSSDDVDGDTLTYTVMYQPAADAPWAVLGSGLEGSSLTVDTAGLAGSTDGTMRVIAHDGFFTGSDEVTGLRVPAKPPRVTIDTPVDGSVITVEQALLLTGFAQTVGADDLPDSAFVWRSDQDGTLGTGSTVLAGSLTVGVHEVTLGVTGPGGLAGEAAVTIEVRGAGETPSMLAVSFDELSFIGTPSSQPDPQGFEIYDPAGSALGWTATSDNPAVTLSASAGTTPAMVDVDVDTSNLLGGETLTAKVTVRRTNGTQEPLVVDVTAQSSLPSAHVSPDSIDFGIQIQGTTGSPQTVTFTNHGRAQMTLGQTILAGPTSGDFTLSDDHCANATLSTGQSCTAAVAFAPEAAGRRPAYLVLPDKDSPAKWLVSLTGLATRQPPAADAKLYGWGANGYGQAGSPRSTFAACGACIPLPTEVGGIADVVDAVAGEIASVGLTSDGHVWTWGSNFTGTLGLGTIDFTQQHPTPQMVPSLTGAVAVASGYAHSLALLANGTVMGWGQNQGSEATGCGTGNRPTPQLVGYCTATGAISNVIAIAAGISVCLCGRGSSFALKSDGTVWQWGSTGGSGGWEPLQILAPGGGPLTGVVAIAPQMALKADGTVWTWGSCADGQSGNGACPPQTLLVHQLTAVQVLTPDGTAPLTGITAIAAYDRERYALTSSGGVLAWGSGKSDTYGTMEVGIALGIGLIGAESVNLPRPVLAPGGAGPLGDVVELAPGLGVLGDGTAVAWGSGITGGRGDGSYATLGPTWPVRVKNSDGSGFLTGVTNPSGGRTRFSLTGGRGGGEPTTLTAGSPVTLTTTAGVTFDEVIASFDDSLSSAEAFAFAASVDWGDGSADSATNVTGPDGGPFEVHGRHAYDRPGTYEMRVDVVSRSGDSVTMTGSVSVAEVALGALAAHDSLFVAGTPSQHALGGFTDPNPASLEGQFTATVDWGDGTSGAAFVLGPPGGPFSVDGEHAYRRAGTYPLVLHAVKDDGAEITLPGNAIVVPASLTVDATFSTDIAAGTTFSGPVARFQDGNPLSSLADYTAVIDWGDGSQTDGAVTGPTGGPYTVAGSHTYGPTQPFTARVTLSGPAGASASAETTLLLRLQHISLTATAAPASGAVPLDTVFSYAVRNDGTDPLLAVGAEGSICGPAALSGGDDGNGVLDPGESWTFTCAHGFDEAGAFTDISWASAYGLFDSLPVRSGDTSTQVDAGAVRRGTALADGTAATVQYSDPLTVRATLSDVVVPGPIMGRTVDFSAGPYAGSGTTDSAGQATTTFTVDLPAGALATHAEFDGDAEYESSAFDGSVTVQEEDATVAYSGDTFTTGTQARLKATVTEAADGSLGDITRASVTFDVYAGATACGSGTPTRYGPVAVADTGTLGDGIGSAEATLPTPGEQTYCIVARLTGASQGTTNPYYTATPAQGAVLTVVSTTGKFATGGGWIVDPATGGHGNFGFTVRFTKAGAPKGQAVYVWRGLHNGVLADFIVKSNSITGLSFADELGNGTFPWRATLVGKATIRINRSSDGTEISTDGNATFTLVAVDSGQSSGIGVDAFAIRVLDKDGREYKVVGTWADTTYGGGILLSGGNVMVHLK